MQRSPASLAAAVAVWSLLALAGVSGCVDPGLPWGWLEVSVQARFDPPEGRLDAAGRLKTNANYSVTLDTVEVALDAVTVVLGGVGATDFEPANPPEGYSLCHNGHCHADTGELVDYEVIALEMAGGTAGARITVGLDGETRALTPDPVPLGVTPCEPSPCELPRGEMAGLELTVASLHVRGTVFDQLTGDDARLAPEGWPFEASVAVAAPVLASLTGTIGPGQPVGVALEVDFQLPPELFDDIDFGVDPPADTAAWQSLLSDAIRAHGVSTVDVRRFDD